MPHTGYWLRWCDDNRVVLLQQTLWGPQSQNLHSLARHGEETCGRPKYVTGNPVTFLHTGKVNKMQIRAPKPRKDWKPQSPK